MFSGSNLDGSDIAINYWNAPYMCSFQKSFLYDFNVSKATEFNVSTASEFNVSKAYRIFSCQFKVIFFNILTIFNISVYNILLQCRNHYYPLQFFHVQIHYRVYCNLINIACIYLNYVVFRTPFEIPFFLL